MIPTRREVLYASKRIIGLSILAAGILFLTRLHSAPQLDTKEFSDRKLDTDRQVVWVRADSLSRLLNQLRQQQPSIFQWKDDNNHFVFTALDDKPFNTLFLDGEYLSRFDRVTNAEVEKLKSGYGFQLPVESKSGSRFVRMPAEIIHSIQLQNANSQ